MSLLNMNSVQEALKTYYLPALRYQMNDQAGAFFSQIDKSSRNVVGKDIVMALRYGVNGGSGMRADDGILPNPSSRRTKQARWETKNIFARIQLTDKVIKASKSSAGAFANILETELSDAMQDTKVQFARMLFSDGVGKLATCSAHTTVNTITVDNTRFLNEGLVVDICSNVGTVKESEREILVVDHKNKTITISGTAVTTLATDILTVCGNYGQELTGLDAIFTLDSTLYGIDRTSNKWLNPTITAVGGELDELAIQDGIDTAEILAGSKINFLLASYGVRRAYQYLMQTYKRTVNTMELKGGWKALDYNGIGLVADKFQAPGTLDMLATEDFNLYQIDDWQWMQRDGAVLSRLQDKPVYQGTLVKYADLACDKPRGQVRLTGITEH